MSCGSSSPWRAGGSAALTTKRQKTKDPRCLLAFLVCHTCRLIASQSWNLEFGIWRRNRHFLGTTANFGEVPPMDLGPPRRPPAGRPDYAGSSSSDPEDESASIDRLAPYPRAVESERLAAAAEAEAAILNPSPQGHGLAAPLRPIPFGSHDQGAQRRWLEVSRVRRDAGAEACSRRARQGQVDHRRPLCRRSRGRARARRTCARLPGDAVPSGAMASGSTSFSPRMRLWPVREAAHAANAASRARDASRAVAHVGREAGRPARGQAGLLGRRSGQGTPARGRGARSRRGAPVVPQKPPNGGRRPPRPRSRP